MLVATRRTGTVSAVAAAAVLILGLAGCSSNSPADADDAGEAELAASAEGTWVGEANGAEPPELTLAADGTFAGFDGCNNLTGEWETDDLFVEFDSVAVTQKACVGFTPWLSLLDSAKISGTTMTVLDDQDRTIGTLERE